MTGFRCPYAVLTACSQSHSFEERRIHIPFCEEESVKVGRSVAKSKPSHDNAIFDCKVLSRNHAVLWCEDGFFFLKDTKSSNGTFVNNNRLSKSAEESAPRQIFSGDILQFGVDIVENTNKVTHGCIIAMIRLFDVNGDEALPPDHQQNFSSNQCDYDASSANPLINSHQLYQLQQYVREATHRERALVQKLSSLEAILSSTEEAVETSWQALINEDRLLSRIEMLEGQLALFSKNSFSDGLKQQISDLLVDKNNFETLAKESLRRTREERCETLQRLADVERCLLNAEEESNVIRTKASTLENELALAIETNTSLRRTVSTLQRQISTMESQIDIMNAKNYKLSHHLKQSDDFVIDSAFADACLLDNLTNGNDADHNRVLSSSENSNGWHEDIVSKSSHEQNSTHSIIRSSISCEQVCSENILLERIQAGDETAALLLFILPFLSILFIAFHLRTIASRS